MTIVGLLICLSSTQALSSASVFELGFHNPLDDTELSWLAQPGCTEYELLRSPRIDFDANCSAFETSGIVQRDPDEPLPGDAYYYLVRELIPDPGFWGVSSDGSIRFVPCMAPTGTLTDATDCKSWSLGAVDRAPPNLDCIEWDYAGAGLLLLTHVNTAFSCCPEYGYEAGVEVEGDTITINEDENADDCDCICLYDLSYEIEGLSPGVYDVIVNQKHLWWDEEPLDFTMDLESTPAGIHCVERLHYPWGPF